MFEAISNFIKTMAEAWSKSRASDEEYAAERAWNQYLRVFR
jgi:hypothetical protein